MEFSQSGLPDFQAPGPGTWQLDAVHFSKPTSRFQTEIHPKALNEGFAEGCRRYGLLIEGLKLEFCNGFAYTTVTPAPAEEIPARFEAAKNAFETKLWRKDLAEWDTKVKPAAIRTHQDLLAEDPSQMSDDVLAAWEELTGPEIARALDISVSAAEQRLHRAKKRFAAVLTPSRSRPKSTPRAADERGGAH